MQRESDISAGTGHTRAPVCHDARVKRRSLQDIPDWDRVYRPGVDIRAYPILKWERAWELAQQIITEYGTYRDSLGEETEAEISTDRRTVNFRAHLRFDPPIGRWSLLFGEVLHNYRSALDGLAWELAHLNGSAVPSEHERNLYFPLAESEAKWERLKRTTLASMPVAVHDRLCRVQPYRFEPVEEGIGLLLNKMSNLDKHRAGLVLEQRVLDKTPFTILATPEEPESDRGSVGGDGSRYEFLAPDRAIRSGDRVFTFTEPWTIKTASVEKLPMRLTTTIEGRLHEVWGLLSMIERQVAGTFINACVGFTHPEWASFIQGESGRPESNWCPNTARYTADMRRQLP
ncbi:hypothetical protein SK224_07035 [Microbacterium sp. BG28]|uniref:hypothetical protein n=1 Tax=Microbacterium sp. BG28 TaxID=3097356 RepID=UPI002A5AC3CA|nr:hypothetical protein [Microbacterium sp. BG28]MDY0828881.1 hypothetical protein [Microbacterium sp. BG28]